ncbi:MAG TPA: LuxR C-terminal-related transcriptional regulator [Pelobium sp.]|nr:LuxR C-terminal-related transcriptional regulator [Pelobium sp.]
MTIIKFDETKKIWHQIAKNNISDNFSFELEIHKKLLNIFHVGDFYYYIFNCSTTQAEFVSETVKQILGIKEFEDFNIEFLLTHIHPEDLNYFIEFEKKVTQFFNQLPPEKVLKYKVSYDYRIKKMNGKYIRLLQQVVPIQSDEHGSVLRVLGVHTDITHLKKTNGSTLSFIGLDGEPSYNDVCQGYTQFAIRKEIFTKREKEIMELIGMGKNSTEIADKLFISKHTVDTHRKNMMKKTGANSLIELLHKYSLEN